MPMDETLCRDYRGGTLELRELPGVSILWRRLDCRRRPDLENSLVVETDVAMSPESLGQVLALWCGDNPPATFVARLAAIGGQKSVSLLFHRPELLQKQLVVAADSGPLCFCVLPFLIERVEVLPA